MSPPPPAPPSHILLVSQARGTFEESLSRTSAKGRVLLVPSRAFTCSMRQRPIHVYMSMRDRHSQRRTANLQTTPQTSKLTCSPTAYCSVNTTSSDDHLTFLPAGISLGHALNTMPNQNPLTYTTYKHKQNGRNYEEIPRHSAAAHQRTRSSHAAKSQSRAIRYPASSSSSS